jgi:DNA-nicking Smr family endonuclease
MLVITGKGDRNGYSIRSELMKWINIPEISSYIIYISEAHYKHGGDGAFYLILRRRF